MLNHLQLQRQYLNYLAVCLKTKQFKLIDLEHIPRIFHDSLSLNLRHSQEMLDEIYPILKLILKFYQ